MTMNLLSIGIQPSEIESMTFSRMVYYNQYVEAINKAQREVAAEAQHA